MYSSKAFLITVGLLVFFSISIPPPSQGADTTPQPGDHRNGSFRDSLTSSETLIGNWGGLRDKLKDTGITPWASYTTDLLGNTSGGIRRGFQYTGELSFGMSFDLERLGIAKGLRFKISGDYDSGWDLSERDIGNLFTAANAFGLTNFFGTGAVRLYQLSLEQSLLDDRLSLLAGRIGMSDDFLTSELYGTFVQTAFNPNPISVSFNIPSFTVEPVATWGFRATFEPVEEWYIMGGVYYSDDTIGRDSRHGVDFSIRSSKGVTTIMQIGYRHNEGKNPAGLPGNYYIGSYYDSNRFEDLGNPDRVRHGNYGLYFHADQMVYQENGLESTQGLTLFLAATFAPYTDINTFPYFVMSGLVYQGLLPKRDDDTTSLGLAYGQFSNRLSETYEMVLELTHNFKLTPWLSLQPDFQYIFRPGGAGDISDSIVVGGQIVVEF